MTKQCESVGIEVAPGTEEHAKLQAAIKIQNCQRNKKANKRVKARKREKALQHIREYTCS